MTVAPDKPAPHDAYGLPKINMSGKVEEDNRDHSRAPITSGGTITGKAFQTDGADPRITFDSTAMICHNAAGVETFRLDIATGNLTVTGGTITGATFQTSATDPRIIIDSANGIRVINASSVVTHSLDTTNGLRVLGATAYALTRGVSFWDGTTVYGAMSGYFTSPTSFIQVNVGAAGAAGAALSADMTVQRDPVTNQTSQAGFNVWDNVPARSQLLLEYSALGGRTRLYFATPTMAGQLRLEDTAAGTNNYVAVPDASSRLRFGVGSGGNTSSVDYVNGNLIFQTATKTTCTVAGQICGCGLRTTSTVAGQTYGHTIMHRHARTDTVGTAVTPGSITLGAPTININTTTPSIGTITSQDSQFILASTAAGLVNYKNTGTVN